MDISLERSARIFKSKNKKFLVTIIHNKSKKVVTNLLQNPNPSAGSLESNNPLENKHNLL